MSLDQYYRRLELPSTASPVEIKRAYRRLRAKYHPDRNQGREASVEPVFKRIQEAFEILIGERKAPVSGPSPGPAQTREKERGASPPEPRSRPPMRGADCMAELFVPLEAAIYGGEVEATYMTKGPCLQCQGLASHRCPLCRGARVAAQRKKQTVRILPGAWDGQRYVVEGGGYAGVHGGAPGDAIFSVVIVCSAAFRRDGLNIACDIEVDFVTAVLGGAVQAHVLGRALKVSIAPNAQSGSAIRLRGQGLTDRSGMRGDLTLHLALVMPTGASHLTDGERQRLHEMFAAARERAANDNRKER
ncbi:MAG: DnaJ domain-containing protein [Burkholderiales bacterium]|nr:DnaJ domain-containing protein [Burkholderiales bacterium]